jgi:hypothetical protein
MEEEANSMLAWKYFLMILGAALYGSAGALVAYDVYLAEQLRRLLSCGKTNKSGKKSKACAPRSPLRNVLTWRPNFLGGNAGQGFR